MSGKANHVAGGLGGEGRGKKLEKAENFFRLIVRLKSQVHEATCFSDSTDARRTH